MGAAEAAKASVHQRSDLERLIWALWRCSVRSLGRPRDVVAFARSWLRFPVEYAAGKVVEETPAVSFADLFPGHETAEVRMPLDRLERHDWNVRLDEKILLGLVVQATGARRIFEIGTFDGATTRHFAEAMGPDGHVFTLDLPPAEFDRTQSPGGFCGAQVGALFHGTAVEPRITQLLGNSAAFDFCPYEHSMDVVFVDAAHDYGHGLRDSRTALRLVRPGGVVLWHDYTGYWSGLVHAIRAATRGHRLVRLAGTTLACVKVER